MPRTIATAAALRSFAAAFVAVLLGVHLPGLGLGPGAVGVVIGLGLAGNAAGVAVVALRSTRLDRRRLLVWVSALSAVGLAAFAVATAPLALAVAAFIGMVNGMGRDRGAAQALDQAVLADAVPAAGRTTLFTRYTLVQDLAATAGSLAAGVPLLLERWVGLSALDAYRAMFALAAAVMVAQVVLYAQLRPPAPSPAPATGASRATPGGGRLAGLATLFALDSVGGGFLAGSILSYWFFRRFGLDVGALGALFFAARLLNAVSYLAAAALARRIGLVRTMVFTHLPSSAVLMLLPFAPHAGWAIALFLAREALVQMDVPTRQSYVAAVVPPHDRTRAFGVTTLVRTIGWAVGPALSGVAIAAWGLAAPLLCGGGLKVAYDLALFASFRHVPAPEEEPVPSPGVRGG